MPEITPEDEAWTASQIRDLQLILERGFAGIEAELDLIIGKMEK